MQHLRGRIAKSDVRTYVPRTTYHVRTYASSTVSRHFGAETKIRIGYEHMTEILKFLKFQQLLKHILTVFSSLGGASSMFVG